MSLTVCRIRPVIYTSISALTLPRVRYVRDLPHSWDFNSNPDHKHESRRQKVSLLSLKRPEQTPPAVCDRHFETTTPAVARS